MDEHQQNDIQTAIHALAVKLIYPNDEEEENKNKSPIVRKQQSLEYLTIIMQKSPLLFLQELNQFNYDYSNMRNIKSHELFHIAQDFMYDMDVSYNVDDDFDHYFSSGVVHLIAVKVCHCAIIFAIDEINSFVQQKDNGLILRWRRMRSIFRDLCQLLYRNFYRSRVDDNDSEITFSLKTLNDAAFADIIVDLLSFLNLIHRYCPKVDRYSISSSDMLPEAFHLAGILTQMCAQEDNCVDPGYIYKIPIPINELLLNPCQMSDDDAFKPNACAVKGSINNLELRSWDKLGLAKIVKALYCARHTSSWPCVFSPSFEWQLVFPHAHFLLMQAETSYLGFELLCAIDSRTPADIIGLVNVSEAQETIEGLIQVLIQITTEPASDTSDNSRDVHFLITSFMKNRCCNSIQLSVIKNLTNKYRGINQYGALVLVLDLLRLLCNHKNVHDSSFIDVVLQIFEPHFVDMNAVAEDPNIDKIIEMHEIFISITALMLLLKINGTSMQLMSKGFNAASRLHDTVNHILRSYDPKSTKDQSSHEFLFRINLLEFSLHRLLINDDR